MADDVGGAATASDYLRLEVSVETLSRLLASGQLCAADFRCLDSLVSDTFLQQSQLVIAIVHIIQRCHFGKQLKQRRFLERRHAQDL